MIARCRERLVRIAVAMLSMFVGMASGSSPVRSADLQVRLERTAGEPVSGNLIAIDGDAVSLDVDGRQLTVPVADVRRIVRMAAAPQPRHAVAIRTCDGGRLTGDRFVEADGTARIGRDDGTIEIPADRIARAAWLAPDEDEPAWLAAVPAEPGADLVVIRRDDGPTFVECAVTGVSTDAVTVVLDGDVIPVNLARVAGIVWLREPARPATGTIVRLTGGRLIARSIRWSADACILDGSIHLPPAAVESIDYAAGRTLPLADLEPEQVEGEPFFGSLAEIEQLRSFFAPRIVPAAGDAPAAIIMRPRTVATWRVPADARRFRARVTRDLVETATARVEVAAAVDGREAFRARLPNTPASRAGSADEQTSDILDLDVTGGRRLTLTIEFAGSDVGCPVRLTEAVFEQ